LRMSKGREFQIVGAATEKLLEPKHVRTRGTFMFIVGREAPEIEVYPSSELTVEEGASASFHCRVIRGYPTPVLTWTR